MPTTIQETREQTELFFREIEDVLPDICFLQEPDLEIAPNYDDQLQKTLDTIQKMLEDRIDCTEIFAITQPILNRFFLSGPHAGRAVADVLMDTKNGKALLLTPVFAPGEFLIHAITPHTLNSLVPSGLFTNYSIPFSLAHSPNGCAALAAHNYALLKQITPHTLNAIIPHGYKMGQSVAFVLASTMPGLVLLMANNFFLGSQITETTLNQLIQYGPYAKLTLALLLNYTLDGSIILKNNNSALYNQLNTITSGATLTKNRWAAPASTREQTELFFREILGVLPDICFLQEPDLEIAPNYDDQLQKTLDTIQKMLEDRIDCTEIFAITQPILNRFFLSGPHAGRAVTDVLMDTENGKTLLLTPVFAPDEFLIHAITASTLNALVPSGPLTNHSIPFSLAKSPNGCAALAAHNYALLKQITPHTLNAIIPHGYKMGQSVAFALASTMPGLVLLMANNFFLGSQITETTLNQLIQYGPYAKLTLALLLNYTLDGSIILKNNNSALYNQLNTITSGATLTKNRWAAPASKTEIKNMLNLFKSHYSHLNPSQFYKIWRNKHQGTYGYSWMLTQLQKAGLVSKKKPLVKKQPPSTIDSSSICPPPLATVENFTDNDNGDKPSTKKMRI